MLAWFWNIIKKVYEWQRRMTTHLAQLSHLIVFVYAEYVNAQEIPSDMKSITDRAAQTLLWTELFRGQMN